MHTPCARFPVAGPVFGPRYPALGANPVPGIRYPVPGSRYRHLVPVPGTRRNAWLMLRKTRTQGLVVSRPMGPRRGI